MKRAPAVSLILCAAAMAVAMAAAFAPRTAAQAQPEKPAPPAQSVRVDPPAAAAHPPVLFTPRYAPGEITRYQVSFRSQSRSSVGGALKNPQGASEVGISVGFTLRLEVLTPVPGSVAAPASPAQAPAQGSSQAPAASPATERPPLRLRAVYESVTAKLSGDAYDPSATKLLAQYQNLQGRTIEFQLGPQGELEYIKGLDEVLQDPRALDAARAWLEQIGAGLGAPAGGAVPGQSWQRSQPVADAPLKDTMLQTIATYLRDEACSANDPSGEQCAVVLMRFSLGQPSAEKNPTPDSFRRRRLRTSGQWTSQGESLVYVSLSTGRTVSVSQTSEEQMDLNIRHEDGGLPFRYAGRTKTETHLLLLTGDHTP